MADQSNFELMATYNQWMNNKVYASASQLSDELLNKDRGAFFGSISGTLNHILVGDRIWFKRFAQHEHVFKSLNYVRGLSKPESLSEILYSRFCELTKARKAMDKAIVQFSSELEHHHLATSLSYCNTTGELFTKPFSSLLQHVFNHQTHHRGQVTTMLSQSGLDVGCTDMLACITGE